MIIQELFPEVQDRIEFAAGHEHLEDAVEFALHAPKGGITIEGKSFRGGQFIPGAVAAQASPEQQKQLAEGQAARKVKHLGEIKTDTHVSKALSPYRDLELNPGNVASAKRGYAALKRYHGEDVGHRINQMIAADLDKIGSVGPDKVSGLPHGSDRDEFYAKRLRAYSDMVDWAKKDIAEGKIGKHGMRTVPLASLSVDPERFQFKVSGIGKGGVTEELKDVKRWRPEFAGAVLVWNDPNDGKDYIVNGHHRYELATRAGAKDMTVHYIRAETPEKARAIGALANVAEGRGTALDAAKFMRDTNTGPEDFAKEGVSLKGQLAKDATILKGLSDGLFHRLTQGTISQNRALAIAEELDDHGDQEQLFGYIDKMEDSGKKVSDDLAKEMALDIRQSAHSTSTEKTLFGDEETTKSVFLERNQLKQFIRTKMAAEANVFKAVSTEKKAKVLEKGGNVIAAEQNKKTAAEHEAVKNLFSSMANYKGEISNAINEAATELAGDSKKRTAIQEKLMEKVRGLAKAQLGMGEPEKESEIKEPEKQEIPTIPEKISPPGLTPAGENATISPVATTKTKPEGKMETATATEIPDAEKKRLSAWVDSHFGKSNTGQARSAINAALAGTIPIANAHAAIAEFEAWEEENSPEGKARAAAAKTARAAAKTARAAKKSEKNVQSLESLSSLGLRGREDKTYAGKRLLILRGDTKSHRELIKSHGGSFWGKTRQGDEDPRWHIEGDRNIRAFLAAVASPAAAAKAVAQKSSDAEYARIKVEAAKQQVPVTVSYDDREIAKKHGARWNPERRRWIAPDQATADKIHSELAKMHAPAAAAPAPPPSAPPATPPVPLTTEPHDHIAQLRRAAKNDPHATLVLADALEESGQIEESAKHRRQAYSMPIVEKYGGIPSHLEPGDIYKNEEHGAFVVIDQRYSNWRGEDVDVYEYVPYRYTIRLATPDESQFVAEWAAAGTALNASRKSLDASDSYSYDAATSRLVPHPDSTRRLDSYDDRWIPPQPIQLTPEQEAIEQDYIATEKRAHGFPKVPSISREQ